MAIKSDRDPRSVCHNKSFAIFKAIAMRINYPVCDSDQASVDDLTRYATRRRLRIGQGYQVCATQVQDCYLLERATRGMRCLRYDYEDRVVGLISKH